MPNDQASDRSIQARNAMMAAAYRGGASLLDIGQRFGLSKQRVHQILGARSDVTIRPPHIRKPGSRMDARP